MVAVSASVRGWVRRPFSLLGGSLAPTVAAIEPTIAQAGNFWTWTRQFNDFPVADSWVLSYAFRGISRLVWDTAWVSNDGTTFTVAIPSTATATLKAGRYVWTAYCTLVSARYTAAAGVVVVTPNLDTAADGAQQTHAEKMLAVVESELEARITGTGSAHEGYAVAGRSIQKMSVTTLNGLRAKYQAEVYREQHPGTMGIPVEIHFSGNAQNPYGNYFG